VILVFQEHKCTSEFIKDIFIAGLYSVYTVDLFTMLLPSRGPLSASGSPDWRLKSCLSYIANFLCCYCFDTDIL